MGTIRVDYDNARLQAKRLRNTAEDCFQIERKLQSTLNGLSQCWAGAAADSYQSVIQSKINEISRIRREASSLALLIEMVADRFEEAERQIEIFGGGGNFSGKGTSGRF